MVMLWWELGLASAAVTLAVMVAAVRWRRGPSRLAGAVVLAHLDRFRTLPRHQALVQRHSRLALAQLLCWVLVALGAGVTMSRLASVDDDSHEMRTRDVMLCLDVSGSMAEVNRDVLTSYLRLVDQLDQERIGFVAFDSAAVSVFPLTRDHAQIKQRLTRVRRALDAGGEGVPGVAAPDAGSSLIGDGLASCLAHFDELDVVRSRTVVFATDNMLSGRPIYSLAQATDLAVQHHVMVFGILPGDQQTKEAADLHTQTKRTHGNTLALVPGRPSNADLISRSVQAQTCSAVLALPRHRSFDVTWPGTVVMLAGLVGCLAARREDPR